MHIHQSNGHQAACSQSIYFTFQNLKNILDNLLYVIKNEYLGNGSESKTVVLVGMISL